jgi:hypothetical protein
LPAEGLQLTKYRPYFGYGILLGVTCIAGARRRRGGEREAEGAPALRVGQAAAPSVVRGPGCRWHWLPRGRFSGRLSRVWMVWAGTFRRAVSLVAFVGPRSGDGAAAGQRVRLRQRMRAALKLLFGPAKTAGGWNSA